LQAKINIAPNSQNHLWKTIVLSAVYFVVFILLVYKVFHVPMTHDEVATILTANEKSIWQIITYESSSPNNHILNTLLTKMMIAISNLDPLFVRLPNLLAFILYAFSSFRISKEIVTEKSAFFIPFALIFIANPYLLDFFGLTRGYGLSIALLTYSLSCIIRGFGQNKPKEISKAVLFSALAAYANFTVLVYFATVIVLASLFYLLQKSKSRVEIRNQFLKLGLFCIGFFTLIIRPILQMQQNNEFQFWKSDGFIENTILPLTRHYMYDSKVLFFQVFNFFLLLILLVAVLNSTVILRQLLKEKNKSMVLSQPLFIASFALFFTVVINILQHLILKTPYFENRTALFYLPLFTTALIAISAYFLKNKNTILTYSIGALLSIILLLHLFLNSKLKEVREWSYDRNTTQVIRFISENNPKSVLETDWMFNPSFYYYKYTHKIPFITLGEYTKELNTETKAGFYYIYKKDYPKLEKNYTPVVKFDNDCWLLKRNQR